MPPLPNDKTMLTKHKKRFIIVGVIVLFFAAIITGIAFYLNRVEGKIRATINNEIRNGTDGLYYVELGDIKVELFSKTAVLGKVCLRCDTSRLAIMKDSLIAPHYTYDICTDNIKLQVKNLTEFHDLQKWKPEVGSLEINGPVITIIQHLDSVVLKDSISSSLQPKLLPSFMRELKIKEVSIKNGSYVYYDENKNNSGYKITNYNLFVEDLIIASFFMIQTELPQLGKFECNFGEFLYDLDNYQAFLYDVKYNGSQNVVQVDSICLVPRYDKHDFAYKTRHPGRVETTVRDIEIFDPNIEGLLYKQAFHADSISIQNFDLQAYKNKNIPPTSIVKPLLHEVVQQLPIEIDIPLIAIHDGEVVYEELGEGKLHSGKLAVHNISGTVEGLTNIVHYQEQYYTLTATAKIMNSGKVNASVSFPVSPDNKYFLMNGSINGLRFSDLNQMLEPRLGIGFETGKVSSMKFDLKGGTETASIDMLMLYQDLDLAVVRPNHKRRWLISELANDIFILKSNPMPNKEVRHAKATVKRDFHLNHINFIFKAILAGAEESVGFTKKKQEQVKKLQEKFHGETEEQSMHHSKKH